MKSSILFVSVLFTLAACEGSGPTAADPGARTSHDPWLGKAPSSVETSCPACPKQQECPAPLTAVAEFLDSIGLPVTVVLKGTTQEQADQLRLAFGMPTREEAEKAARTYLPRENFDPKAYQCKRVGVANVWPYLDPNGTLKYGTTFYDNLYVPVIEGNDSMIKSVIEEDDGRLVVVYFRVDELVSSPDKAVDPEGYYKLIEEDETIDDLVLVPGTCRKEIVGDGLAGLKREKVLEIIRPKEAGGVYPVLEE